MIGVAFMGNPGSEVTAVSTANETRGKMLLLAAQKLMEASYHTISGNYSYPIVTDAMREVGAETLWEVEREHLAGESAEAIFMAMLNEMVR